MWLCGSGEWGEGANRGGHDPSEATTLRRLCGTLFALYLNFIKKEKTHKTTKTSQGNREECRQSGTESL